MSNLGHRLGEYDTASKENTLDRMEDNYRYQSMKHFKYWEFDIQESLDGVVFVYHDRKIKGLGTLANHTWAEIKNHAPFIPTLMGVLQKLDQLHVERPNIIMKPIRVEIKLLVSNAGRTNALKICGVFRDSRIEYQGRDFIHFIAFPKHFKKSFPHKGSSWWKFWNKPFHMALTTRERWAVKFSEARFYVLSVKKKRGGMHVYDMFKKRYVL